MDKSDLKEMTSYPHTSRNLLVMLIRELKPALDGQHETFYID